MPASTTTRARSKLAWRLLFSAATIGAVLAAGAAAAWLDHASGREADPAQALRSATAGIEGANTGAALPRGDGPDHPRAAAGAMLPGQTAAFGAPLEVRRSGAPR